MSFRFDKSEVPQFESMPPPGFMPTDLCVACHEYGPRDRDTGLCRPCWRVVILGPAMANQD